MVSVRRSGWRWLAIFLAVCLLLASCAQVPASPTVAPAATVPALDAPTTTVEAEAAAPTTGRAAETSTSNADGADETPLATAVSPVPDPQPSVTSAPYDPAAEFVRMEPAPLLPEDAAALLAVTPPEGGGNILLCGSAMPPGDEPSMLPVSPDEVIDTVKIGGRITFCYYNNTLGPARERVLDPNGREVRSITFDLQYPLVDANDYTPLPGDPPGRYTVIAETPDGTFEQTFTVASERDTSQQITVLGRGPGYQGLQDTEYLYLNGFAPGERLDLYFYETCQFNGVRRQRSRGGSLVATAQVRVNQEGYIYATLSDNVRAALAPVVDYLVMGRLSDRPADPAVTPSIQTTNDFLQSAGDFDLTAPLDPAVNARRSGFDVYEDAILSRTRQLRDQLRTCPAPVTTTIASAPATAASPPQIIREYGPVLLQETPLDFATTLVLGVQQGRVQITGLGSAVRSAELPQVAWDLASGQPLSSAPADPVLRWVGRSVSNELGVYAFTANDAVYVVTERDRLYRVSPGGENATVVLSDPVGWNAWLAAVSPFIKLVLPSVTVSGSTAFIGAQDKHLYAVDIGSPGASTVQWSFPLERGPSSAPAVSEGLVMIGSYEGYLYAVDAETGEERWRFAVGDWVNTPVIGGDTVYVRGDNDILFALEVATGRERWRYVSDQPLATDPVMIGDAVAIGVLQFIPFEGNELRVRVLGDAGSFAEAIAEQVAQAPAPVTAAGTSYRVIQTSDGFVSVREHPERQSAEVRRLSSGTTVVCEDAVAGETIGGDNQWAYCPAVGGYIFRPLLEP